MKILPGILALVITVGLTSVRACDLCGCYTPQLNTMPEMNYTLLPWARGWYGAVGEQFTRFGTLQLDGEEIANPTGQYLNSSITQIVAGYQINTRFALQINVPLIYANLKGQRVLRFNKVQFPVLVMGRFYSKQLSFITLRGLKEASSFTAAKIQSQSNTKRTLLFLRFC